MGRDVASVYSRASQSVSEYLSISASSDTANSHQLSENNSLQGVVIIADAVCFRRHLHALQNYDSESNEPNDLKDLPAYITAHDQQALIYMAN